MSNSLRNEAWVIPTSQSIHIIGVSVVLACAVLICLRLLGVGCAGRSVRQRVDALLPWMYRGLVLLLLTGILQIIAEPVREFVAPVFWYKMIMIAIALSMTISFAHRVRASREAPRARWFAVMWLVLWIGIVFCGRLIAYTWELYA